jgi:hypothetical protein
VAGALAALLVAGFAAAALIRPSAPPPPVVVEKAIVPVAVEQTAAGIDDGVPTALNETKRASGECHHGL